MAAVKYLKKNHIAYITINSTETMNAIGSEVRAGLEKAYRKVDTDDEIRVAIITGAGDKAFSAGANIKEFESNSGEAEGKEPLRPDCIWKPFIAAIHGYCLGGGLELALMCDIRIASEDAVFGFPEVTIGTMPGAGGAIRLPGLIPGAVAAEMLLTGRRINAAEAYRIGLVSRVVRGGELLSAAGEIAAAIAGCSAPAVHATKELMITAHDMSLEEALVRNRELAAYVSTTPEFINGKQAFLGKRAHSATVMKRKHDIKT